MQVPIRSMQHVLIENRSDYSSGAQEWGRVLAPRDEKRGVHERFFTFYTVCI